MAIVTEKQQLFSTRLDLPEHVRMKTIEYLNQTLASVSDLTTQIKQAHWNVKGKDFYQLHLLFDTLAEEVEEFVDKCAERITTLGGTAFGTARQAAKHSILPEYPLDIYNGRDHIVALSDRYAIFAKHVREGIDVTDGWGDKDTADLYTEISRNIDMRLWFFRSTFTRRISYKLLTESIL